MPKVFDDWKKQAKEIRKNEPRLGVGSIAVRLGRNYEEVRILLEPRKNPGTGRKAKA
jgi:hypothetical protein